MANWFAMVIDDHAAHNSTFRKLRVDFVTETYLPEINGVAKTLSQLVTGMSEKGHVVRLIKPRHDNESHYPVRQYEVVEVPGVPIPGYPGLQFGLPAFLKVKSVWKRSTPDVIYIATEGPLGWAAEKIARNLNIPVVSGFHTNFHSYSDHYNLGVLNKLVLNYLRSFHNRTKTTLVPTESQKENLQRMGFFDVSVLGRGIDIHQYSPQYRSVSLRSSWDLGKEDIVFLYVGRIAAEKNIQLAIDAYDSIEQGDKRKKRFVLVGDGPELSSLKSKREDLIFAGEHTGIDLSTYYASADVFLFPSETETFGNVVLEALASGLALIAYDYAAAHEVGEERINGLYPSYGERTEFIQAAQSVYNDRELLKQLKQNSRKSVMHISWGGIVSRFQNIMYEYGGYGHADTETHVIASSVE